jgi:spore coat polysaccharide biosynthesis predicted glycosyltransferase SpsG
MPRRVLFRADASHGKGFGHVARLCALIEELQSRGDEPIPLFGGDAQALASWARYHQLNAVVGDWSTTQTIHVAEEANVSAVVIDGPSLVDELAPKLFERKIRTIVIDDKGGCLHACAAVVNHNVHADELRNTYVQAKKKLLGRRYAMLRKDIRRYTRGSCRPMTASRLRVIVTYGGSDPVDATSRTLRLLPGDRPLELVVIAGPAYQHDMQLRDAIDHAKSHGHTVDLRRAPDDPGALFVSADAAICSAGGTLGELAYLGCPTLAYAIAGDQVVPARHSVRHGLIFGGRTWLDTDDDTLRSDFESFLLDDRGRLEQRQRALATVDSDGARRIVDEAIAG